VTRFTSSERKISSSIRNLFGQIKGRVIISTFASNVYRVQQIVEASVASGRKVIVFGRSMEKTINVGQQLNYIKAPEGTSSPPKNSPISHQKKSLFFQPLPRRTISCLIKNC
jgi:ribonuclease J